jgi:hypothetical protein
MRRKKAMVGNYLMIKNSLTSLERLHQGKSHELVIKVLNNYDMMKLGLFLPQCKELMQDVGIAVSVELH